MAALLALFSAGICYAQDIGGGVRMPIPKITFDIKEAAAPRDVALSLQVLFLLTILTLAPAIIMMMTAFTRVVIVMDFIKRALSLQQMPPNQIIIGFSLFLTFFIMAPTFTKINEDALQPYLKGKIDNEAFFNKGMEPLRVFMFKQTREKDIALFIKLAKLPKPKNQKDVPTYCLIPAFMISELKRAFEIGVFIFIPFIVIDMIVASALMAMGMIMLPPIMISLPFKIILFILVDGWNLLAYELVRSFK
ncbi:MAG TPA: flagellar type III secretion system pore protein FliP [Spirochaetota bacterium]|nr:flagellar type III secretion system pore protein FliP [Spirochaetota bacterium]HPC40618.1 flagellar type III secretion system pore protein FliP [Spirochaetota bacterium]HPL18338.1 flagellar type III secretion system pore protein FliP [Spirochaetota bacterium]HQF07874.1 flagellar type III secretion system pore protein FliP [Spirochaetota bacterium]HQH96433.1 flagellar type III secretion system pore protein FliP [Spirochaetota bacterium]